MKDLEIVIKQIEEDKEFILKKLEKGNETKENIKKYKNLLKEIDLKLEQYYSKENHKTLNNINTLIQGVELKNVNLIDLNLKK